MVYAAARTTQSIFEDLVNCLFPVDLHQLSSTLDPKAQRVRVNEEGVTLVFASV
jgi:hypothetical protein